MRVLPYELPTDGSLSVMIVDIEDYLGAEVFAQKGSLIGSLPDKLDLVRSGRSACDDLAG